ncbi:hypothetical protein [Flavobacterium algicola]|uniref:hypothetical protein n=1 Tax=Flavobacterium algicola TaxID=556529 RepID=UPI001EFE8180|nr:hypothetical protein [Flavobacterium algicola]MCG9791641.1 hypothetical protein [Flavobacterium algicola]
MKKKQIVIAFSLGLTVLLSILLQSVHAQIHHYKEVAQHYCHHENHENKTQITHLHYKSESCSVCHFSFGNYVSAEIFNFQFKFDFKLIPYFSVTAEKISAFSGCFHTLRGPPFFL